MFEDEDGIEENRLIVWLEFMKSYPKDRIQPHYIVIPGASGQLGGPLSHTCTTSPPKLSVARDCISLNYEL